MSEQVQLELIRSLVVVVPSVLTIWVGRKVAGVHNLVNSVMHEDRKRALEVSEDKAVSAHAAGVKEEKDKHGVNSPLRT